MTEFVPLDGGEDGEGHFLENICSQLVEVLGNLDPYETTMLKKLLCSTLSTLSEMYLLFGLHINRKCV